MTTRGGDGLQMQNLQGGNLEVNILVLKYGSSLEFKSIETLGPLNMLEEVKMKLLLLEAACRVNPTIVSVCYALQLLKLRNSMNHWVDIACYMSTGTGLC